MNKHFTVSRAIRYLLYLSIASTLVFGVTYARYIQEIQGQGTVSTAAVAMDVTEGTSELDLTKQLQGLRPGETRKLDFAVTNKKGGVASEVAQEYSISISTTGNLPLTYTLAPKYEGSAGTYVTNPGENMIWNGGRLPYSEAGITHTYTLTVAWPSDKADEDLSDEIDLVTLTVDANQAVPTPAA